jgi:ubiquinone biosynthesis protein UbiJ
MLARQPSILSLLSEHAGRTVQLRAAPIDAAFTIDFDGALTAADTAVVPDVVLTVDTAKLWADGWRPGQPVVERAGTVHISGDVALAKTLSTISRSWRPDMEDWLSQYVGDLAAIQLVSGVKQVSAFSAQFFTRTSQNFAEYFSHEARLLTAQSALANQTRDIAQLSQQLAAIEARVQALQGALAKKTDADHPMDQS